MFRWSLSFSMPAFAFAFAATLARIPAAAAAEAADVDLPALEIQGEQFVDPEGRLVRFWGVNVCAVYPTAEQAGPLAQRLADRGVNLVRPHHVMRPSGDWVWDLPGVKALATYGEDTTTFEPQTLDRFDRFNAELRRRGIRLAFTVHGTRHFKAGDAAVWETTPEDAKAWGDAVTEIAQWGWQRNIDVWKMLPVVDERAARVMEKFTRALLTHVNPHSGLAYGVDPQILYVEVVNEHSLEYAIVCGNRFPAYMATRLQARWEDFAREHGDDAPGDLYKPDTDERRALRSRFFFSLDEAYYRRIEKTIRETGCGRPVIFSNLWRGESMARFNSDHQPMVEDHAYIDPFVAEHPHDFVAALSKSALDGKPFVVGELNVTEGDAGKARMPYRTQLPLAAAAYGSLHGWSGVVWFAWLHGHKDAGVDGWARAETRNANLGVMLTDGMMLDHLRTTGTIFREGLVARARETRRVHVAAPYHAADYHTLMRPQKTPRPGWSAVHALRKTFAPADGPDTALFETEPPRDAGGALVSDTGEIFKHGVRRQLSVCAPRVAAFSGVPDGRPASGLAERMDFADESGGFATVIAVVEDGDDWRNARRLRLSLSALDDAHGEREDFAVRLRGLPEGAWRMRLSRPRAAAETVARFMGGLPEVTLERGADGALRLPGGWREAELFRE